MLDEDRCIPNVNAIYSQETLRFMNLQLQQRRNGPDVLLSWSQRPGHLTPVSRLSNTEMKSTTRRARKILSFHFLYFCLLLTCAASAVGQIGSGQSPFSAPPPAQSTSQSSTPAVNPGASITTQNPLFGSVPEGKATDQEMPLSIMDAISLGLKHNLGLILNQVG